MHVNVILFIELNGLFFRYWTTEEWFWVLGLNDDGWCVTDCRFLGWFGPVMLIFDWHFIVVVLQVKIVGSLVCCSMGHAVDVEHRFSVNDILFII